MAEKYKIGELAKKFGVSVQTIRFYEEKGLLTPTKDEHTGYRYYDNWNINFLLDIIQLKKQSFSLNETKEILTSKSLENITQYYNSKEIELIKKIHELEEIVNYLENQKRTMNDFYKHIDTFKIVKSPRLLFHSYRSNEKLLNALNNETDQWIQMIPEASPTFYINQIDLNTLDNINYLWGYSISSKKGIDKDLDFQNNQFISSQKALYCTFEAGDEHTFSRSLKKVIEKARKQNYTLISNPFGRLIIRTQDNNHMKRYFEIWLPIE